MQVLAGQGTVWPALAELMRRRPSTARAWAAVAYIGRSADQWLSMRAGDTLVCDASDSAVQLGLTSVDQLRRWSGMGVHLYSRQGLHAKTGVFGNAAFIGSANASLHSARSLDEAVLVLQDTAVRASIRAYVKSLRGTPSRALNAVELDRLATLPVREPKWPSLPDANRPVMRSGARLHLWEYEYDRFTSAEQKRAVKLIEDVRDGPVRTDRVDVTWLPDQASLRTLKKGDYFCWSNPGELWVSPPAEILYMEGPGRGSRAAVVFLARGDLRSVRRSDVDGVLRSEAPRWGWRGPVPNSARDAIVALAWYRRGSSTA